MLVLFDSSAGFGIFKVLDEKKLEQTEDLEDLFENEKKANKVLRLIQFKKFADSAEALQAGISLKAGKLCKPLKKLLKKVYVDDVKDKLMVSDPKLGTSIKDKLNINVTSSGTMGTLMKCINIQIKPLIPGCEEKDFHAMSLGLAHNLSRYKLKFSPDKVDTMVIQAINLLDDLDKEVNNFVMRAREWYGWHFPELGKIIPDHTEYVKTVCAIGTRQNVCNTDLSHILHEDIVQRVLEAAEVSMGTEIVEDDVINIQFLCKEIQDLSEYRAELNEYLFNRTTSICPNLAIIVGELVGARLISHAGSLMNLAKLPASTIQLLGAEKALFSALKARKSTPKYGIIYHASMVSSAGAKFKGKMARMLAAKAALASRCDALSDTSLIDFSISNKARLNSRMKMLESGYSNQISGAGRFQNNYESYESNYNNNNQGNEEFGLKRQGSFQLEEYNRPSKKIKIEEIEAPPEDYISSPKKQKIKREKINSDEVSEAFDESNSSGKKKKKKTKNVNSDDDTPTFDCESSGKKKKIKHEVEEEIPADPESLRKKKKHKRKLQEEIEDNSFTESAEAEPKVESSGKKKKRKSEDSAEFSGKKKKVKVDTDLEVIPYTESSSKKKKVKSSEIVEDSPFIEKKKKKKKSKDRE